MAGWADDAGKEERTAVAGCDDCGAPTIVASASSGDDEQFFAARRVDFPVLDQNVNGRPLAYLDNAATSQTPLMVTEALREFYDLDCSNIHRGVHTLSQRATDRYEGARDDIQRFVGAAKREELIFVRGATEAINLVAASYGEMVVSAGDEIVVSEMEHHSNIVPWQQLCARKQAKLRVAPMNDRGELLLDEYRELLGNRTKLVAVAHVSNALGTVNPIAEIARAAHDVGAVVLVDGAQAVPHQPVDVVALGADFYAFSGHKLYGPTGIGALYARDGLLNDAPPYQGGGDMIRRVSFNHTTFAELPYKYEAGTPNIAGAIGFGAAIRYVESLGLERIAKFESGLVNYATERLSEVPGLRHIGTAANKAGLCSFVLGDVHPHDVGTFMDQEGVAIRTGHHCAQPVMDHFGLPATSRASFGVYNTKAEIDRLVAVLFKVLEVFSQ